MSEKATAPTMDSTKIKVDSAKVRMRGVADKLINLLKLNEWDIKIEYVDTISDGETDMDVCVDDDYLRAKIRIAEDQLENSLENHSRAYVAEQLLHELIHILIDPMYFIAVNAMTNTSLKFLETERERTVTRFTNIIKKGLDLEKIWEPSQLRL